MAGKELRITDTQGNLLTGGATVEVRLESSGALAAVFSNAAMTTPLSNPFTDSDNDGKVRFYVAGSAQGYRIDVTLGGFTDTLRNVPIGSAGELDATAFTDVMLTTGIRQIRHFQARDLLIPTTAGATALAKDESATNKVNDEYLAFPDGSTTNALFSFRAPKSMDESAPFTFEIEWKEAAGATTHVCRWRIEAQAQGNGDTIDSAWSSPVNVDSTGAAGVRSFNMSGSVTPAGSWAAGDKIMVRISRLGGNAADTLNVAAHLIGVAVFGTVNSGNDA